MAKEGTPLKDLSKAEIPAALKIETYFDLKAYPSIHEQLLVGEGMNSIIDVVGNIGKYAKKWIADTISEKVAAGAAKRVCCEGLAGVQTVGKFEVYVEEGATFKPANILGVADDKEPYKIYVSKGTSVLGSNIFLNEGDIFVGEDNVIEQGVGIKGPTIIGKKNDIRHGAYFRGNVIISDGSVLRGELKNVLLLDKANFPHPSYLGDSVCGYMSHFGNQATAANVGIFQGLVDSKDRVNITLDIDGKVYDAGTKKLGIIIGDWSQVGCNSVADPATFLAPYTVVYPLTSIRKGFYGPKQILKNKPMEKGVIEISDLR
jgi:UDP-N-acetylglucosamine diphosphorylase / glucose-1-phosphate thymidylyltransferase / UDP-N-acetylgalactosamine diphosphorylase / glucosamine-1-phosphate N-acetyltransferase / galactosamine-1-phosphate N-acetyltransferase